MQTVQEIYQNVILSLPENEQLKLASLILEKVTSKNDVPKTKRTGGDITKLFGMYKDVDSNGSDNEQIDRDLARAYADDHED